MFTALSSSTPTLTSNLFAQISKDVSAYPTWFIAPSGLDLYWQVVEYTEDEVDLMETMIRLPKAHFEASPLPAPACVFHPKTELAKRLWEIRLRSIASGENKALLDWKGVQKEVAERRGERG